MPQPSAGAEPVIAALADGTLFIAAKAGDQERPNLVEGAGWLWRSDDRGSTWSILREPMHATPLGTAPGTRGPFGSLDPDVVTSPDGWVYYLENWGARAPARPPPGVPSPIVAQNYLVERSSDGGRSRDPVTITATDALEPTAVTDRPWLAAGPDGRLGLYYLFIDRTQSLVGNGAGVTRAVFSADHGETWGEPVDVTPRRTGHVHLHARPLVVGGTIFVPYLDIGPLAPGRAGVDLPAAVRVAVSPDDGRSWESFFVAAVPEGTGNLLPLQGAADAKGRLFLGWAARAGENMALFFTEGSADGHTWNPPVAIQANGTHFQPWLAARGDGQVAVAWYGGDSTGDPEDAADDAPWFAFAATRDGEDSPWRIGHASEEPVKTGPICVRGGGCTSNHELLDNLGLTYDTSGVLHLAFARSREIDGVKAGLVMYARTGGLP
ncbi:MAG: hypothetical protein ACT4PT_14580 [Methanobacteriota archaeon]